MSEEKNKKQLICVIDNHVYELNDFIPNHPGEGIRDVYLKFVCVFKIRVHLRVCFVVSTNLKLRQKSLNCFITMMSRMVSFV